ncbi:MAG TPA: MFS transporter [Anaeromyxobacter sp.]|nr:MFS transporter [Anaeromyxobacter sp.]
MNAPNGAPRTRPASAAAALSALSAAAFAAALDRAAMASVVESLRADLWLTDARLGGLVAAAVLAASALAPAFASLAGRRPPARVLALGVAVAAAGTMLSGAARRGLAILVARLATGAGPAARDAAGPALAATARRAGAAALAGAAAGYALGAVLSRLVGWRWALVGAGAPGLAAAVACLRLGAARAGDPAAPLPLRGADGLLAELRRLRADRARLLAVVGQGATTFAAAAMAFWTPAFLERTRGVPRVVAGLEFGVVVLMAGLGGTLAGARAVERLRARTAAAERWVAGAAALAAAPLAVAAYAAWRPRAYLVSLVLAQLLLFAAAHAAAAAAAAPAGTRAALAAAAAVALLAEAPAAALVGLLSDRTSLGRALAVLVPVALAVAGGAGIAGAWREDRAAGGPRGPPA